MIALDRIHNPQTNVLPVLLTVGTWLLLRLRSILAVSTVIYGIVR